MNYEQEYKNAFEAAKGLHDAGNALTKKQMEIVFPQLSESEDEKIRKFLIDYFTSYKIGNVATKLNGYRIDDILAYLEKQKEQKQDVKDPFSNANFVRGYESGYADAKREQKSAEWSEDDEQWLESIIGEYERRLSVDKDHAAVIQIKIDFLKSLRNRVGKKFLQPHWKPSEDEKSKTVKQ